MSTTGGGGGRLCVLSGGEGGLLGIETVTVTATAISESGLMVLLSSHRFSLAGRVLRFLTFSPSSQYNCCLSLPNNCSKCSHAEYFIFYTSSCLPCADCKLIATVNFCFARALATSLGLTLSRLEGYGAMITAA